MIGSVYDIATGEVRWLGPHPELARIVGKKLPVHAFKTKPYVSRATSTPSFGDSDAGQALSRLFEGVCSRERV